MKLQDNANKSKSARIESNAVDHYCVQSNEETFCSALCDDVIANISLSVDAGQLACAVSNCKKPWLQLK